MQYVKVLDVVVERGARPPRMTLAQAIENAINAFAKETGISKFDLSLSCNALEDRAFVVVKYSD